MQPQVLCVPNVSEGRDEARLDAIVRAVRGVPGVSFLDLHSDPDHNRSVLTFAGSAEAVAAAAFACARAARDVLDLSGHEGCHPRRGALDVLPFVPLGRTPMDTCERLARETGARIARELAIPVRYYGYASDTRRGLADIRKNPGPPDEGPAEDHPTAGSVAVGARFHLIAFNVMLETDAVDVARRVARSLRKLGDGLPSVQALGFPLPSRGCVQVSMNLLDYRVTTPYAAYKEVERLARREGVAVLESELVGLIPREAVMRSFREAVWCAGFRPDRVLETRLARRADPLASPKPYLDALAADTGSPGGGSAAALSGACGAALVAMLAGLTLGRKRYAAVEGRMREILARAGALREELSGLVRRDAEAYGKVLAALRGGRKDDAERAMKGATETPLAIAELCAEVCELAAEAVEKGNRNAVPDAAGGARLAEAGCLLACDNVRSNVARMEDRDFARESRELALAIAARAAAAGAKAIRTAELLIAEQEKSADGSSAAD